MTDKSKSIIINGVDVSKCERLIINKTYGYVCNCEEDTHLISSCKNRPDCYFKQLTRKTQECEGLKNKIKYMEEYIKTVENARDELERESKFSKEQAEQKLKRIKDICKSYCELMCLCEDKETCKSCTNTEILQIIDEVKNE